jgi:ADP-ribose pyrophosphatase YjhB (NUDIX family)
VHREFTEEYGMTVKVTVLLGVAGRILPAEGQHRVPVSYPARHVAGTPEIREPGMCLEIGWFDVSALPRPLSPASRHTSAGYRKR